jgi:CBS domain containing-hemolysin-like protein
LADRNATWLDSDAPEIEAIRLCCRSHIPIPVVEKGTDKVIGIISGREAIRSVTEAVHSRP